MFEGLLDLMRGGRTSLEGDAEGDVIDGSPAVLLEVLLDAGGGGGSGDDGGGGCGGGSGGGPSVSFCVWESGGEAKARALLPSRPAPSDTARSEKGVAAALAELGEAEWAAATRRMRLALAAAPAQAAERLQAAGGGLHEVEQALRAAAERAEAGGGARHGRAAMALRLQLAGYAGAGAHGAAGALREWDAAWAAAPEQTAERRVVEVAARARLRRMSGDEVARARAELRVGGRISELCVEREAEEARQRATATAARWRSSASAAAAAEAAVAARTVPREGQPCNCVPPLPHAEGEEGTGDAEGAEGVEGSEGALEVSVALARCAVALARAHADADGKTCKRQLIKMRASAGFVELARRAARLRTADAARLGDGARLAFWLNVYNALVLHGCALHAPELPHGCLRIVRLHARFCYEIGGSTISAIEIEHAVLRKLLPRPTFPGASWLIPKFGAADPRAALAPPPCTLLCFGLVPGTAFAPPLRAYGLGLRERVTAQDRTTAESAAAAASGVELQRVIPEASGWDRVVAELEANAREHLAATAALQLDASGQGGLSAELQLPVQLYWHQVSK